MTVPVRYLTGEEVILIHERILARSGGAGGIRDWGLLDSAVQRPRATFGGEDLYLELFAKAAALGHSLVLNHLPLWTVTSERPGRPCTPWLR